MSTDPSIPEVSTTTQNSSSKRLLDGEHKSREDAINTRSRDENKTKRIKVETVGGESSVDTANPSKPIETSDSVLSTKVGGETSLITQSMKSFDGNETASIRSSSPQTTNYKDKKDEGGNGARVGNDDVAPSNTGTIDAGVELDALQTGGNSEPLHAPSPAVTRSRSQSTNNKNEGLDVVSSEAKAEISTPGVEPKIRWRVHQMAEDYTNLVGSMMYPATEFEPYGYNPEERQYPLEKISLLGFITSPFRRPTIIEKWSPYEIALFEGSMLHYGKDFHTISRQIRTKTTQEVIDFYYIWKKTAHYKKWKQQYVPDEELIDDYQIPLEKPKR